jgi:hypothetical protein
MKKIGLFLAVLAGVVTLTSSANASNCKSIADSMQRLRSCALAQERDREPLRRGTHGDPDETWR